MTSSPVSPGPGTPDLLPPRRPAPRAPLGWLVPAVTVGGLLPAAVLILDALGGALGANPVQRALHQTGQLALIVLLLSLVCTPLRRLTGWTWPARVRKALGLLAFFYALLHFAIYLFDHDFAPGLVLADVLERPFITAGFTALLLLVPLALTSTPQSVRRLGFARWTRLHQLVYASACLGALHYWWGVKKDHTSPLLAALALSALLAARWLWPAGRSRAGRRAASR